MNKIAYPLNSVPYEDTVLTLDVILAVLIIVTGN